MALAALAALLFPLLAHSLSLQNVTTSNSISGRSAAVSFGNATAIMVYGGVLGTCPVSPVTSDLWGYSQSLGDWTFLGNATTGA